jgi:uncharacterized protein with ParB-like and HNH nuclease domain
MLELDELEVEQGDNEENEGMVTYDIATYPSDFTLSGIFDMWQDGDITIPEFQREFVWSITQSSLLIESFLCGLPVPPVFFYIDDENKNLVIDGQQRILSTVFYLDGYFGFENFKGKRQVFRLQGLDERSPYYRKSFDELPASDQRKLKNSVLRAINIRQLLPTDDSNTSAYHIFERLNTGGTALKPQEIRNCVFSGNFSKQLKELNQDDNWRTILGKKALQKHQTDVELVLRMFALSERSSSYEKPMKDFLNKGIKKHRKGDSSQVERFINLFPKTTQLVITNLGEKPFHVRGPLNTSVLDSVFCTLMDNLDNIPPDLKYRFEQLKKDREFLIQTTMGTTDTNTLRDRFDLVKKYLIS